MQKTAYEIGVRLVGSEMCIRDRVWTVHFFDTVKAEMRDPVGLNKLVWKLNWGQYPEGSLIMCSRQMRRWLLQDDAFADHYSVPLPSSGSGIVKKRAPARAS